MRINLTVKAGPHEGRRFEFEGHSNFIVGRSARANFPLPEKDKSISRIHFMIEMNPPQCRLIDMGSTNKTRVNGQEVTRADLKDGDLIKAGMTTLLVTVIESEEPPATPVGTFLAPAAEAARQSGSQAVPLAAPPPQSPPGSSDEFLARPRPPGKARGGCRVCAEPLEQQGAGPGPAGKLANANAVPLCLACRNRIRHHPQPIPGYQVVRELGQGGMGVVYQALRAADGTLVALKTIKPAIVATRVDTERFLREAQILNELDHENIVSFHEMGEFNGLFHFAMDYVAGIDAAQLLKQHRGLLPVARAVDLVCQLLRALDYAHAKGFVHRDIKPANMLLTQEGGRELVKLSDFGLSRIYQTTKMSGLTMDGDLGGTPAFMAPEQITELRNAGPPVDQYSAGATLYNLLTGSYTYDFPNRIEQKVMKILLEDPVPIRARRPDLPAALAEIIHRALAREPQARFANMREMRRALAPFAQ